MTDLEWLARHMRWTEVENLGDAGLLGINPISHKKEIFPRYDQSTDLMMGLVGNLEWKQQVTWLYEFAQLVLLRWPTDYPDFTGTEVIDLLEADASLRLKAYRQVMKERT